MAVLEAEVVRCNKLSPGPGAIPAGISAGGIVQVRSIPYAIPTTLAISANTYTELPFSVTVSPVNAFSKFMVYARICGEFDNGWDMTFSLRSRVGGLFADSVAPAAGSRNCGLAVPVMSYANSASDNGSTPEVCQFWYYLTHFTGSTADIQFTPLIRARVAQTIRINRTWNDNNANGHERMISQLTVFEVS